MGTFNGSPILFQMDMVSMSFIVKKTLCKHDKPKYLPFGTEECVV